MRLNWVKLDKVHSTNSYLAELIRAEKAGEGTVVIADYQESGKGRGSNRWLSNRGENILISLALLPEFLSASRQFQISRIASLAICDFLTSHGLEVRIKWPNDIVTPKGKISGILIEHTITGHTISHSIIGIGLNLNQTDFPKFPVIATSMAKERGSTIEPGKAAEMLVNHLIIRYDLLKYGGTEELEREYLDHLFGMGRELSFSSGKESFRGVIRGVNEFGELLVQSSGVIRTYGFHEIKFETQTLQSFQ